MLKLTKLRALVFFVILGVLAVATTYAQAAPDAVIVNHNIPSSVHTGDVFQVSITVQNTGDVSWERPLFRLYSQSDPVDIWGPSQGTLIPDELITPGSFKTFTFLFTAPDTEGIYDCDWQMAENGGLPFGDPLAVDVDVTDSVPKILDAAVVSHTIPSSMCAGEQREVSVTMRNTGSTTIWYRPSFKLLAQNFPEPDNQWVAAQINLDVPDAITPGSTKTFTFNITAPVAADTYNCNWGMEISVTPGDAFFGELLETTVQVGDEAATCDDGNECTGDGTCTGGACLGAPFVPNGTSCDIDSDCTTYTCTDGVCGGTINESDPCDDGDDCTSGDTCNDLGICTGTLLDCTGQNDTCIVGVCNPYSGPSCVQDTTRMNYSDCDDSLYCTGTDTCFAGICESTGDPCAPEACDEDNDICGTPIEDCTDGVDNDGDTLIDCEDDECDGLACDDGFACTESDTCVADSCDGTPNDSLCDDANVCTDEVCTAGVGCEYTNNTDPCDDGLYCNGDDTCSGGSCLHSGDPCPPQICDEGSSSCVDCTLDTDCDDGISCTDDTCTTGTCTFTPNDLNCPDDGLFCTGTEFCDATLDCSSTGDPCSPDLCDDDLDVCVELGDFDEDGVPDISDNCPQVPNGPLLGTCLYGLIEGTCMANEECGLNGFCGMNQEDNYPPPAGNGLGDACECEGDFDCDGDVDGSDANLFKRDFGRSILKNPCPNCP